MKKDTRFRFEIGEVVLVRGMIPQRMKIINREMDQSQKHPSYRLGFLKSDGTVNYKFSPWQRFEDKLIKIVN